MGSPASTIYGTISPNTPVPPQSATEIPGEPVLPPEYQQKLADITDQLIAKNANPAHILAITKDFKQKYAVPTPLPGEAFLNPANRQKLTGIVGQLRQQGAPPDHINAIIKDFTAKYKEPIDTLATYVPHTFTKLAHNLNIQNTLDAVGDIDTKLGQGDYSGAWDSVKGLVPGIIAHPIDTINAVGDKFAGGDYSGATADFITHALVAEGAIEGGFGAFERLPQGAKQAIRNAGGVTAAGAKGGFTGGIEAFAGPRTPAAVLNALRQRQAGPLAEAAQGAGPALGLHAGAVAMHQLGMPHLAEAIEAGNVLYGGYRGARAAILEELARQRTARAQAEAQAATEAAGGRVPPTPPSDANAPGTAWPMPSAGTYAAQAEPIAPDVAAQQAARTARQEVNARLVADRKAKAAATSPAAEDPLLEQLSLSQLKKPLKKTTPQERASLESLAARVRASQPSAAASLAAPGTPAAAAPSAPPATPPGTAPSPVGAASPPNLQTPALPAEIAPSAPAPVSPSQASVAQPSVPSTGTTAAGLQHYYPVGSPTHIPTPEDLGLGVYSKGGSGKAASGRVLKYENQKGYAAALWAYKNGITDPGVFDRMTEAEKVDFMNGRTNPETGELEPGAIQHAKEMNNPAPKGPKYQVNTDTGTILGENTLEFAKAHLRKLVADGGPRPATAPETVERLRGAAGEPTAAETVEGMRPEPPSLLQQVGEALKEETGSVGPGSGASKELRQALREKARTTVERLRDYTWLLPPPEGERVSPLRAGMQDYPEAGTATRGKGSAVIDFLRRKMEREAGVGGPQNERRVFKDANGSIAVGKITNGDWWKRAQENLSPDELRQAREWYSSLENFFRQHFGEEKAPRMALAWLLANQNTSPSGAMLNVLRAIDLEAGKARIKSAGLAEEKIHQAIQGDLVKSGFGPKLSDFVDSALGKFTRTWMGDDPRGGRPAVIDIWANRDVGKVDTPLYNYLKDRFGEKAVQDLKVDGKSIGETQYEHGSEFYNKLTDYLNKRTIDGGNWTPAEAQAVGWVAMQKAMGKMPEFPADIITKNARRVSLSAEPAEGSPLQNAGHTTIPPEHMRYIVDQAAQKSGVKLLRQENASGAVHHTVFGSPESIQDFADMVGHGAQQSSVTATRPLKSGKAFALDVMHQPGESALSNEAEANDLVSKLRAALPENLKPMADQVQPFTDGNGNAGLRFLKSRGTWNADNIQTFADTLGSVAADKPYALDVHPGKIDLIESGHDWQASPDGQSYLTSLTNRGRVQEAQWLQHELRPAVEARLQSQSAGQATRRQASSAGNKPEAPAQAVSEPARVTVERLRKAGKNIMSAVKDETGSIGPGSGAKAELLQSLRSEILRWYQSYNKAFSDDAADAIMRKEILPRFQQFTAALDELKQSGVSPERLRQYTQGIFPDEPPSEPEPRGTFIIEGQMKPGGKWRDVGEGPWETHSEAHRYGEAEVGIPWRVREKGKPFAAPRKK